MLERALESVHGAEQSTLARDAYSLIHFPMLCGVIAYAFAIEEIVAQPVEPLPLATRLALAIGLVLFVGGMAVAIRRATRRLLLPRTILIAGTAVVIVVVPGVTGLVALAIALVGVVAIAVTEQRAESLLVARPG